MVVVGPSLFCSTLFALHKLDHTLPQDPSSTIRHISMYVHSLGQTANINTTSMFSTTAYKGTTYIYSTMTESRGVS